MDEWLTVTEIEKETGIPNATARRYVRQHGFAFLMKKKHRNYLVHRDSINLFYKIRDLYARGMNIDQVNEMLPQITGSIITVTDEDDEQTVGVGEAFSEIKQGMMLMAAELQKLQQEVAATKEAKAIDNRHERLNDALTIHTVQAQLRREALEAWKAKPQSERMRKIFLWVKEEDASKKADFIRLFVDERLAERLKNEYKS